MASIPLPALSIKTPDQPDLLQKFSQLQALRNSQEEMQQRQAEAPARMQLLNSQVTGAQLDNQLRNQQVQDATTLRTIAPNFVTKDQDGKAVGYDFDGYFNAAASSGVSPQTLSTIKKGIGDATLATANATKAERDNEQALNTQAFDHLEGLRGAQDPAQRQQIWNSTLQWVQQNAKALRINPAAIPQQVPDDNALNTIEATLGMHAQQITDAGKKATAYKDTQQGNAAAATASSSLLKQYAPTLSQSANQQDYATKLNAFETLHPDLKGTFPQQFDPKNPQAVLSAAMTAPELADYLQKDRLAKYTQAQENYRAQLGRQTTFENTRMLHGMNQIDQYTADPSHGYGQFVSQAGAVKSAIQQAKNGNELAASLEPMMVALGVSSFAGVHRINSTEINQAGPAVGSVFRRVNNLISTVGTGKPTDAQLNEATSIIDNLTAARHNAYVQGVSAVAANTGLDPKKVTVFDRGGNIVPLASLQGKGAGAGSAPQGGTVPRGATMKVPGSDGQLHWSDGKNDLGVVQ